MKYFKSIKFRMNIWYLMLLAIVLLFFSIVTYQMLAQRVSKMNLDTVKITALQAQIISSAGPLKPDDNGKTGTDYNFLFSYVVKAKHLPDISSSSSSPIEIGAPEGMFTIDQKDFISIEIAGDQQIWFYYRPSTGKPGYYDLLVVTQSKAPSLSMLGAYKQILYVAIPVTLFLAGFLGYFLIKRLLHPLGLITKASKEMQKKDLNQKIDVTSQDELGELSATLNQTFERLNKSFEREHQFTSDTSHELRAPLAIMQGEATLALNQSRSEVDYRQHLGSISEQISHMSSVVNKLLFLARSEKGKENLIPQDINLKDIIVDIIDVTRFFREEKKLALHADLAQDILIRADGVKLKELFLNLIDNAIKYTPTAGNITISSFKHGDMVTITVKDTGIGIPKEHLPHIFERFYRVNQAGSEGGNGLGLAICKCIVELHQGKIEVESKVGEGTIFSVTLPLVKDQIPF